MFVLGISCNPPYEHSTNIAFSAFVLINIQIVEKTFLIKLLAITLRRECWRECEQNPHWMRWTLQLSSTQQHKNSKNNSNKHNWRASFELFIGWIRYPIPNHQFWYLFDGISDALPNNHRLYEFPAEWIFDFLFCFFFVVCSLHIRSFISFARFKSFSFVLCTLLQTEKTFDNSSIAHFLLSFISHLLKFHSFIRNVMLLYLFDSPTTPLRSLCLHTYNTKWV